MEAGTSDLVKAQRKISIIFVFALLAYSGLSLALIVTAYKELDFDDHELSDIIVNWQTPTILDLVIADSCDSDYEPALQTRRWPGTKAGCWCGNVDPQALETHSIGCNPFCEFECSNIEQDLGCQNVPQIEARLLDTWAFSESNMQQICLKRSSEALTDAEITRSENCPSGTIKCGISPENVFCTKESRCPINRVQILSPESGEEQECVYDSGCIPLMNSNGVSKRLVFERGSTFDALPLVQFELNEYAMCNSRHRDNITPGRKSFPLMKNTATTCYNIGAKKWNITDQTSEALLFQANELSNDISLLNEFDDADFQGYYPFGKTGHDYTWGMFTRNYIPWKVECRDQMESLIEKSHFMGLIRRTQLSLLIIGTISTFSLGIIVPCLELENLRRYLREGSAYGVIGEKFDRISTLARSICLFTKVVQLPFQLWSIILSSTLKTLFSDLTNRNCSDTETQALFAFLSKAMTLINVTNTGLFGILLLSLFVDMLLTYWMQKTKKSNNTGGSPQSREENIQLTCPKKQKRAPESPLKENESFEPEPA